MTTASRAIARLVVFFESSQTIAGRPLKNFVAFSNQKSNEDGDYFSNTKKTNTLGVYSTTKGTKITNVFLTDSR